MSHWVVGLPRTTHHRVPHLCAPHRHVAHSITTSRLTAWACLTHRPWHRAATAYRPHAGAAMAIAKRRMQTPHSLGELILRQFAVLVLIQPDE